MGLHLTTDNTVVSNTKYEHNSIINFDITHQKTNQNVFQIICLYKKKTIISNTLT